MKRMRILTCSSAILALVFPAMSGAAVRSYHGVVDQGGTVSFKAKFKQGRPVQIIGSTAPPYGFTYTGVPMNCDEGSFAINGHLTFPLAVHDNGFLGTGSHDATKATVHGTFRHHGRRVQGTFRLGGDFYPSPTDCHTGLDTWHAHSG